MSHKTEAFAAIAQSIIKNLEKRNMEGYYFETSKECVKAITDSMPQGSIISWGGSETIKETGLMDAVRNGSYELIDRADAKNPDEARQLYAKTVLAEVKPSRKQGLWTQSETVPMNSLTGLTPKTPTKQDRFMQKQFWLTIIL